MLRSLLRVFPVVLLILLAILVPFASSGYSELRQATAARTYADAARHYQNAAQRLPWRADLYELSGHMYYYAKEYAQAQAAYQKAFQQHRLSPEGWVAWGDVLYLNDDREGAMAVWEQAASQKDPSPSLYSRLAEVQQSNGEYSSAARSLQVYVSGHPEDASAHYRLGLLFALSDVDRALSEVESASRLDSEFQPVAETLRAALRQAAGETSASARFVVIGRGLGLVNEWQLARAAFESALEADGKNGEAWAWLGEANQQTGAAEAGLVELDRALSLNPDSAAVRGLRGLYFERVGNFRQALVEFEAAAALEPENPAWYVSLGEAQSKNGDLIRALQAYRTATLLAPEDASYWRLLAIFCAQNQVNIRDVGIPAAQKALLLSPQDPAVLDVLGWLLTLDGRYEESRRMLTRALDLDPENASAHLHLGILELQLGNRASARDHLLRSHDLGNKEAGPVLKQYFP